MRFVLILSIVFGCYGAMIAKMACGSELAPPSLRRITSTPSSTGTLSLHEFSYDQDFEAEDPFSYWLSDGTYSIHFKGLTRSRTSSGKSAFKLDVTLGTATKLYCKIPVQAPSIGRLFFKGELYVESTNGPSVTLGTNERIIPSVSSGLHTINRVGEPTTTWVTQTSDLVAAGDRLVNHFARDSIYSLSKNDVGIITDKIGLFIFAPHGGRIVLFVDNIHISGEVPSMPAYQAYSEAAWQGYLERVQTDIASMAKTIMNYEGADLGPQVGMRLQSARAQMASVLDSVDQIGYPSPHQFNVLKDHFQSTKFLAQYAGHRKTNPGKPIHVFPLLPIRSRLNAPYIRPFSLPGFAAIGNHISLRACRGEFEPGSFVIRSEHTMTGIMLSATDLLGPSGSKISADEVDIKIVKCWYQAGDGTIRMTDKRTLLPELLLNDDGLIKVDHGQQRNYIKVLHRGKVRYIGNSLPAEGIPDDALIQDAETLQPFSIQAGANKQIWVTVHVPDDAVAGNYQGRIRLQVPGKYSTEIDLSLEVLPFDLHPPMLEYAIYYRGRLPLKAVKGINSEWKTEAQYRAELENLKKHGVLYPTLFQSRDRMLPTALSLRANAGLPTDKLYALSVGTGNSTTASGLNALGDKVAKWLKVISGYGYEDLYIYGIDEASGENLKAQRAAWQRARKSGAKIFAACKTAADIVGDLLDNPILSGTYNHTEVEKFHKNGKKVFSYSNPQVGVENPEIYRRNFGLGLVCAGYDGAMDYAYQHSFGHIWNDFDHPKFRDHVFAYPTSGGPIDTIQWEGFREAVDDVRYLSTLIAATNGRKAQVLNRICPMVTEKTDMHALRRQMINDILSERESY